MIDRARSGWAFAAAVLASFASACRPAATATSIPRVAATIFPLYDIVREIGGADVRASVILPPGGNPYTFDPSPRSVAEVAQSAVIFRIGHGLDDWAAALAQSAGVASVVIVDEGIDLRRFAPNEGAPNHPTPENVDPHYFLTIRNARRIAATVELALSRIAPQFARRFAERRLAYLRRLQRIDLEILGMLSNLPVRQIATFNNAFEYFAQEYGLEIVAVFEPFPGQKPGLRDIAEFERRVRENKLKVIFGEPQVSLDGIAPMARDLGVRLSMLDDIGGVAGRESYVEMMLFNARQIGAACGRGSEP